MADNDEGAGDPLAAAAAQGPLPANDDSDTEAPDREAVLRTEDDGVIPRQDPELSEDNAEHGDNDDPDETANALNMRS